MDIVTQSNRDKILAIEAEMLELKDHQIEIKTTHHFSDGVYMREIFIPKGATVVGKIHKTEHLNILSQGHLLVETEDGVKELKASTVIKSKPGIKRVGHALEDTVWITVHPNVEDIRDVEKLEELLVVDTFEQLLEHQESRKIEGGMECHL